MCAEQRDRRLPRIHDRVAAPELDHGNDRIHKRRRGRRSSSWNRRRADRKSRINLRITRHHAELTEPADQQQQRYIPPAHSQHSCFLYRIHSAHPARRDGRCGSSLATVWHGLNSLPRQITLVAWRLVKKFWPYSRTQQCTACLQFAWRTTLLRVGG